MVSVLSIREIAIRQATQSDADFLAWTIFTASRGHLARGWFDIILEKPVPYCLDFCRRLTLSPAKTWWHHGFFRIAEIGGRPAGALCAFRGDEPYEVSADAMADAARGIGMTRDEHHALWPRGAFIMSCTTGEDEAWTVENVATHPDSRGRGVAGALIADALALGRAQGNHRAQISFLIGNDAAEHAYAKAGFAYAEEKRAPEFQAGMGVPGVRRFARDI
jgi:GNAT superfamily N-acetyltransferase